MGDSAAEKPVGSSVYFQIRMVRSSPEEAIWVGERNLADLMDDV